MIDELYDAPLTHPVDDLLGVATSAQILASRLREVQPPFTAGIYGEWGSGKTTFVSFVADYLREAILQPNGSSAVLFIPFSAWPYKTADEVWRALILTIARRLLSLPDSTDEPRVLPRPQGLADHLKSFLTKDAFIIRDERMEPDSASKYDELVAKLDGSLYGGISKSAASSTRLNTTEASLAVAKGVVAALAGLSPMMSALRRLFGLNTDIDPSKLFDKEQNQSTRQRIESMDAFRRILKELFRDNLSGRRVFVFIDDLDRCMPDAALDLLEAIKIFLTEEAPCTFIVAADETLIGQGLRMRLRDLPESSGRNGAEEFLAQKGREYFEKIVQLPVHLPRPGSKEIQRFIGAGFPEWMPASDLIEAAIGTNPRRVKQYCSRLQYQRMAHSQNREATIFDELVTMRCKDEVLFDQVRALARKSATFATVFAELEQWALHPEMAPHSSEALELQARIGSSRSLLRILAEPPEMSKADPNYLLTLARFADLRPDAERMFWTDDRIFMRLLDASKHGNLSDTKLMLDDFSQLAVMELHFPVIAAKLREVGRNGDWIVDMTAVEKTLRGEESKIVSKVAKEILDAVAAAPVSPDGTNASDLIGSSPLFSSMPVEEVLAYGRIHPLLPSPDTLIDKTITQNPSPAEKGRALAGLALKQLTTTEADAIKTAFRVRQEAINQVLSLRTFVKKDVLDHCWPSLYDYMRRDYAGLVQIEKQIQSPDLTPDEAQGLKPYLDDEQLVRLLKLQPYFRDMPEFAEVRAGFTAAPPSSAPIQPPPVSTLAVGAPSQVQTAPVVELPRVEMDYEDVSVGVRCLDGSKSYTVELRIGSKLVSSNPVTLDWGEIRENVRALRFVRELPMVSSVREIAPVRNDFSAQLKSLGLMVYDKLFQQEVRQEFLNTLVSSRSLRIHWEGDPDDPVSALLPWECLYVPTAQVSFLALTRNYSLTRRSPGARSIAMKPITGALRILFVSASPRMVAPLPAVEQETAILDQIARAAGGRIELRVLSHASIEDVNHNLREFRPHLFHFSGHGVYREENRTGELVFETESGEAKLTPAEHMAVLLHDYDVFLAVLNGCDTGVSSTNDAVSSVAGALVKAGVPAVVATMRAVEDEAAMLFTREFYRSFFAGFTVEGSIAEARKALSLDYWDWAAYALFVGSVDLNSMRVMTTTRSDKA